MKKLVQLIIKSLTKVIIKKYKPFVIAVTGSVGKTSTKESIYLAISDLKKVERSAGNLNTEIGAPLVFLRQKRAGKNPKEWISIIAKGFFLIIKKDENYPEIVVVEMAADKPGDIGYLSNLIKPNIGVVTAVGKVPVHIEFYRNAEEVAKEKEKILAPLVENDFAILNKDDMFVSKMKTVAKKITFGFEKDADVLIKECTVNSWNGSSVIINYQDRDFDVFLSGCFGSSFAYIAASTFATLIALQVNPDKIPALIEKIRPSHGRIFPLKGISDSFILDGSYNASPSSMQSAIEALNSVPGKRKVAVLGDMLELGNFSKEEHHKIGKNVASFCDYLFVVGEWAEEVKKSALHYGMKSDCVFSYKKSHQAIDDIEKIIQKDDVILVKGSQGVRMEKIVFSIMRDFERADELLVRQDNFWKKK